MSESHEPIGTVSDEPAKGTRAAKSHPLRLVAFVAVIAVIGLGAWQVVALHQEVSSLRTQISMIKHQSNALDAGAGVNAAILNQLDTDFRSFEKATSGYEATTNDTLSLLEDCSLNSRHETSINSAGTITAQC